MNDKKPLHPQSMVESGQVILKQPCWIARFRHAVVMTPPTVLGTLFRCGHPRGPLMKLTHKFAEMTPEKRPQDPHMAGTGLRFETLDHGGKYPDTMPQAIKLIDAERRSAIYVPITQDGKVVDSLGYIVDPEDE
jgi:hypothetical protein